MKKETMRALCIVAAISQVIFIVMVLCGYITIGVGVRLPVEDISAKNEVIPENDGKSLLKAINDREDSENYRHRTVGSIDHRGSADAFMENHNHKSADTMVHKKYGETKMDNHHKTITFNSHRVHEETKTENYNQRATLSKVHKVSEENKSVDHNHNSMGHKTSKEIKFDNHHHHHHTTTESIPHKVFEGKGHKLFNNLVNGKKNEEDEMNAPSTARWCRDVWENFSPEVDVKPYSDISGSVTSSYESSGD